jgi:hypothetical protein
VAAYWNITTSISVSEITEESVLMNSHLKEATLSGVNRCRNGLKPSRDHFIAMESENMWTVGPNALKGRVMVYKHMACVTVA